MTRKQNELASAPMRREPTRKNRHARGSAGVAGQLIGGFEQRTANLSPAGPFALRVLYHQRIDRHDLMLELIGREAQWPILQVRCGHGLSMARMTL